MQIKMKKSLAASLALHMAVIVVLLLDLPFLYSGARREVVSADVPVMVDLSRLKIAEKTNLPKQVEKPKEQAKAKAKAAEKPKVEDKTPKVSVDKPKPLPPKSAAKEKAAEKKADAKVVEEKPKEKPKEVAKPAPKKEEKPKAADKSADEAIKNLLASVEKIKADMKQKQAAEQAEKPLTNSANQGVKGGTVGSYASDLTISEKDAIAAKLRDCWNLDAGVRGIGDMVVELKVSLRQDGSVAGVKIADNSRYSSDSAFRSVAESARRAVFICGNKAEESPFYLLSSRHPDKYEIWQDLVLFFNPLDGKVK